MYLIGSVIGAGFVLLACLARREEGNLLRKISIYLYKKGCIHKSPLLNAHHVQKDLESLHPGQSGLLLQGEYYMQKIRLLLLVLGVGTLLGVAARVGADMEGSLTDCGELMRPSPGEGEQQVKLRAWLEGERLGDLTVAVPERQLDRQEAQELYERFWEAWEREALGDNPSWDQVSLPLTLAEELEGYPFAVSWESSDYEVLGRNGTIHAAQMPAPVTLTVESRYLEDCWQEELELLVVSRPLEGMELLTAQVLDAYHQAEQADPNRDRVPLPEKLGQSKLSWQEVKENHSLVLMLMTAATAAGVFLLQDRDLHRQVLKRRERMKENYPMVVNKFILYLGAGMPIRRAFQKIAQDYRRGQWGEKQPLYEEMLLACNRLQAGISESQVYEMWAARTGLQDCARLSTMLVQNLKKGNAALLVRMKEEGDRALQDDLNLRRKKGEEAGTRLLAPMVMMMAIVMVLVMIPAFQSFGI
ncbi:MAG: hypothetical protein HFH80_07305 [Lachnospiraceae bacterium]|nr:hypothetical protein [Lachnospiraceae bacterium]